jgi:hypothetical protein
LTTTLSGHSRFPLWFLVLGCLHCFRFCRTTQRSRDRELRARRPQASRSHRSVPCAIFRRPAFRGRALPHVLLARAGFAVSSLRVTIPVGWFSNVPRHDATKPRPNFSAPRSARSRASGAPGECTGNIALSLCPPASSTVFFHLSNWFHRHGMFRRGANGKFVTLPGTNRE